MRLRTDRELPKLPVPHARDLVRHRQPAGEHRPHRIAARHHLHHYRLHLSQIGSGNTSESYLGDRTFTTLIPRAEYWRQQYFGSTANTGNAADTANPAGDGINNLMKYALGLDPNVPSAVLPQAAPKDYGGVTYLRYTFVRNPNASDVTYEVDAADSPAGPWTAVATSVNGTMPRMQDSSEESSGANGMIHVEVHDTTSVADAPRRFMRLQVMR